MSDFSALVNFIGSMLSAERPARILEISGGGDRYGHLLKAYQEYLGISNGFVDRIVLSEEPNASSSALYDRIRSGECLDNSNLLDIYDFILILDPSEHIEPEKVRALLDALQYKITKQILIITPLDSPSGFRKYHPVLFVGLDFSYSLIPDTDIAMQAYSVFPKIKYDKSPIDHIPEQEAVEKMNIAFALPYHGLTGGMKALLQQIRYLTRSGHNVSAYFRSDSAESAIPPWSDLTDDDYTKQVVIPSSAVFPDQMRDADIVVLGSIDQAREFISSGIPAVLWEQGAEAMFGDFGKALHSSSPERLNRHSLYSQPIHLLAVSDILGTALKGIYNREAFIYPNGMDTSFYHPAEKQNDPPVILLTGHPSLSFKGFRFAFDVLQRVYAEGLRFKVRWAAQVGVRHGKINFPLEVIVKPPQHELAEMYRSADIFLSTSLYESYPLPPLEAMASGTAVVATDCGGIRTYAKGGENCILCRQGDLSAASRALSRLINSREERERLARSGRETALRNSAETVIKMLERHLFSIVRHDRQSRAL